MVSPLLIIRDTRPWQAPLRVCIKPVQAPCRQGGQGFRISNSTLVALAGVHSSPYTTARYAHLGSLYRREASPERMQSPFRRDAGDVGAEEALAGPGAFWRPASDRIVRIDVNRRPAACHDDQLGRRGMYPPRRRWGSGAAAFRIGLRRLDGSRARVCRRVGTMGSLTRTPVFATQFAE
jgi:hypothetical protein